jgi:hypothetical protein
MRILRRKRAIIDGTTPNRYEYREIPAAIPVFNTYHGCSLANLFPSLHNRVVIMMKAAEETRFVTHCFVSSRRSDTSGVDSRRYFKVNNAVFPKKNSVASETTSLLRGN